MKMLMIFFALITITQAYKTGNYYNERIINGKTVKAGEITYLVSLQTLNNLHFCCGLILNKNYVMTAAHCIDGLYTDSLKVVAGTNNLRRPNSTHTVEKFIMHENYSLRQSARNDIALMKVKPDFVESSVLSFVLLPLPYQNIPTGSLAIVSGWGKLRESGRSSSLLQKTYTFITSENYCRYIIRRRRFNIYRTHICAITPNVRTGPCYGDSGGSLTVKGVLVGISSWAIDCASPTYPAVYTRVSEYIDWIKTRAV